MSIIKNKTAILNLLLINMAILLIFSINDKMKA